MAIRTLLLDLGNVLVLFSHERMCAQIAQACGVSDALVREVLFENHLQRQFERGELSEPDFHLELERAFGRSIDFQTLKRAGADIFELNQPLVGLMNRWKRDGYRLVLLSNTCVTHYEWVRQRFDLLDRFDATVLSFRVGAVKPEDAIFRHALESIGCEPHECFYTDDIPAYVERGRAFGLQTALFTDVPALVRHLATLGVVCDDLSAAPGFDTRIGAE
jgi:glucose-1-phosphatase